MYDITKGFRMWKFDASAIQTVRNDQVSAARPSVLLRLVKSVAAADLNIIFHSKTKNIISHRDARC